MIPARMDLLGALRLLLFPVQILFHVISATLSRLLPSRSKDLSREVVLITGGGRGIGRHLAKEFSKQGARKVGPLSWGQLVSLFLSHFSSDSSRSHAHTRAFHPARRGAPLLHAATWGHRPHLEVWSSSCQQQTGRVLVSGPLKVLMGLKVPHVVEIYMCRAE